MDVRSRSAGLFALSLLGFSSCSAEDPLAERQLEARRCPDGVCESPPDEEPPPEEDPVQQPDPAKVKSIVIPTHRVASAVNAALFRTIVQISHTDGEVQIGPGFFERCTSVPDDDTVQECLARCNGMDNPKDRGPCRAACGSVTTCEPVCNPTGASSKSFVHWGEPAVALSAYERCDETTCPACVPRSEVLSLRHELLEIPTFRKHLNYPPVPFWVECKYNRWRFEFDDPKVPAIAAYSSPYGISFEMAGTTGSPAVICDNLPDIYVEDLVLRLTFRFPWFGPELVIAEGELEGDLSTTAGPGVDYVGDVGDQIKNKVREIAANRLNKPQYHALYVSMFRALIENYISNEELPPVDVHGKIQTDFDGLHVQYWTK
jgi:hypothetical protein